MINEDFDMSPALDRELNGALAAPAEPPGGKRPEQLTPGEISATKHLLASLAFRQGVDNFRGGGSSAMLFDYLAEEDDTLAVDQEC